ncbi:transcriptional regulator, TetR family [Desulfitobacterium hafniense DCB-2]|uniref:Transcriptional regulator, TetR family n=1 Tax=Desulfitobacterium hafniense (strain DSM 10664 / DCB-2) TaxID=272564 RepID=B8FPU1_DESHD|nr:TetR/AcrR family transcriptional regulator [Desulfitobacterium hafniense]ACL19755.1 transcriptional regulator, TetR family [Desulfitobacterium hafniense DCB-2]
MNKHDDLRVIKTRKLIKEAFYEAVHEKGFDKITVSDIAGKAMINRSTFYLHYKDKFDLLRSLEDEVLEDIEEISLSVTRESIQASRLTGAPFPHIVKLLTYVQENSEFFQLTVRDNTYLSFYNKMGDLISKRTFEVIFPQLTLDGLFSKYLKHIVVAIFSSIINQWIKNGMQETKEDIASLITKIALSFLAIN